MPSPIVLPPNMLLPTSCIIPPDLSLGQHIDDADAYEANADFGDEEPENECIISDDESSSEPEKDEYEW